MYFKVCVDDPIYLERLEKVRESFFRNCHGYNSLKRLFLHADVEMHDSGYITKPMHKYHGPDFEIKYVSSHLYLKNGVYYFKAIVTNYTTGFIYVMDQFFAQDFVQPLYYTYKKHDKDRKFVERKEREQQEELERKFLKQKKDINDLQ